MDQYPKWLYSENHPKGVLVQSINDLPGLPPGETWHESPALHSIWPIADEIAKIPPPPMTAMAMQMAIAEIQRKMPSGWLPVPDSVRLERPDVDPMEGDRPNAVNVVFEATNTAINKTVEQARGLDSTVDKRTKAYRESLK